MTESHPTIGFLYVDSPLGKLQIGVSNEHIIHVKYNNEYNHNEEGVMEIPSSLAVRVKNQFDEYFSGKRFIFDLPLLINGTSFQQRVWTELLKIQFGKTISYAQLARQLGDIKCIRAAASANGKNPLAIIIPCHRVIGSDGSLTGYAGGIEKKRWLLDHENTYANGLQSLF